jgi:hypothetical protein
MDDQIQWQPKHDVILIQSLANFDASSSPATTTSLLHTYAVLWWSVSKAIVQNMGNWKQPKK